jgi:3-methyladenine DNA glycosylase Tag
MAATTTLDDEKINQLLIDVAVIRQKLDALVSNSDVALKDHEARIRKLEQNLWRFIGIAVVGWPVITVIITMIFKHLGVI